MASVDDERSQPGSRPRYARPQIVLLGGQDAFSNSQNAMISGNTLFRFSTADKSNRGMLKTGMASLQSIKVNV